MGKAIILLGTNLGDKRQNLAKAIEVISQYGKLLRTSGIYESPSWGYDSSNTYFNQVVLLETSLASPSLLEVLLDIEKALGRVRNEAGYTDRTMDLDILDYEGEVSTSEQLVLPHPRLHLRLFTLLPMAEVAPHWVHPTSYESIDTLMAKCPDRVQPNRLSR